MQLRVQERFVKALAVIGFCFAMSSSIQANAADLISSLTSQLGVTNEQATGGAGAIFDYAKKNLSVDDFSKIASGVPGMDKLLEAAPDLGGDSALGKLGGLMGDSAGSLGGLASLAGSFESLGLDADTVSKYLPIVQEYIGSVSGEDAMKLLGGLF